MIAVNVPYHFYSVFWSPVFPALLSEPPFAEVSRGSALHILAAGASSVPRNPPAVKDTDLQLLVLIWLILHTGGSPCVFDKHQPPGSPPAGNSIYSTSKNRGKWSSGFHSTGTVKM